MARHALALGKGVRRMPAQACARPREGKEARKRSAAPRVQRLPRNLAEKLLPAAATGDQFKYYFGGADALLQRLGISLAATVLAANSNALLAAVACTAWVWVPLVQCTRRNLGVRQAPIVGLWDAEVLAAEYVLQQSDDFKTDEFVQIRVGDGSGARLAFEANVRSFRGRVEPGQRAVVLVLADDDRFLRFKAIKDVYIPELDAFVGDYPFLDRSQVRVLRPFAQ